MYLLVSILLVVMILILLIGIAVVQEALATIEELEKELKERYDDGK